MRYCEWPRRSTAEKGDDFASSHDRPEARQGIVLTKTSALEGLSMSALGQKQTSARGVRPVAGQIEVSDLTGCAGLSKSESHGQTAFAQHRVQAAGRAGVRCRRDPLRARQAA